MKKFFLFALVVLFSCNERPVPKPDKLLDEETMLNILYDTALLQAAEAYMPNKLTENKIRIKNYIYLKYNIDSTTYYQNQRYYAADIKNYHKMFQKVSERIDQSKVEIDTLLAQENRKNSEKNQERKREFNNKSLTKKQDNLSSQ
ncbi:conserved hypothetical protein [Flavobacterium sp. 9AF]|uniref:DUF4296 domain-containing protein n=1 Tax=Flavobacterium sp. 9AF TaxID=2653142 RepID=UPI0012F33A46|nr:DUF4296 domain-containing protein [Flavobacterium sp. 9AF]VXB25606.1 conserved hypothetical protein [Flavobacterium sp. 9AF]